MGEIAELLVGDRAVAGAAVIGMVLGIYNFVRGFLDRRVSLEVIPKVVLLAGYTPNREQARITSPHRIDHGEIINEVAVEIINRSQFPVTVTTVGFGKGKVDSNLVVPEPIVRDGGGWPRELGPRQSVEVYAELQGILESKNSKNRDFAFATTACNHTASGSSKAMKLLLEKNGA